ncbi:sugar phosphate isomerase/epimerase [Thalassoglobus sp. JC818]|uniref:sugar phosphate isomerase/epimerase family protein n=1 Tax=Thalassoglobus sp. JC818 TaxID=3232136 RepID=UPI00345878FA
MINRREMLTEVAGATALGMTLTKLQAADRLTDHPLHIATNTYPWSTFARRDGKTLTLHTDELLADIASTGITGYEPIIHQPAEFDGLKERLSNHNLEMRSLYVNSVLHDEEQSEASIDQVLSIAERAADLGTHIIVTNPSPIRWGGSEDKSDSQLIHQAESLNRLGAQLKKLGITLAYHNHDSELRQGAREFHHMLTATNPEHVKFCLDAHWVYRGCGNSQVALFDAIDHYADRIVELHLRQSKGGIWTESFTFDGDLNYARLFDILRSRGISPHLVLEQSIETGTSASKTVLAAHQSGYENLKESWK